MNEDLQRSPLMNDIAKQASPKAVQTAVQAGTPALGTAQAAPTPSLLDKIEELGQKIEALAAKDEGYIKKYWPIAAGIFIALTRFF